jgi:hypothetical protein
MRVSIKRPLAMKPAFNVGAIALQAIVTGDERGHGLTWEPWEIVRE